MLRQLLSSLTLMLPILLVTSGCATLRGLLFPADERDARVEWEKDMKMVVNGKTYYGLAVLPKAEQYNFQIYPAYKEIDRIQWKTCHRGDAADHAVVHGIWPWSPRQEFFSLKFKVSDIEAERACPLRFAALSKKNKSMAFGWALWPDIRPWISISSTVECNGDRHVYFDGVSACQAPVDTIQRISLRKDVVVDERDNPRCPPLTKVSDGLYEYFMPKGECVYLFKIPKKHESGRYYQHNHYTFGFEKTPPAER